jgi:peptidoglycan hydrolase-like protein with peptidoglycan-binding domain
MKTVLSQIDGVITSLESKGLRTEANKLDNIFTKVAQANYDAVNGKMMQEATKTVQSALGISADGLFGPGTATALVRALDGISPEPFLKKDYVMRVREYVAGLPAGFVSQLKNFVGMKDAIRALENVPATTPGNVETSDVKIRILKAIGGYKTTG